MDWDRVEASEVHHWRSCMLRGGTCLGLNRISSGAVFATVWSVESDIGRCGDGPTLQSGVEIPKRPTTVCSEHSISTKRAVVNRGGRRPNTVVVPNKAGLCWLNRRFHGHVHICDWRTTWHIKRERGRNCIVSWQEECSAFSFNCSVCVLFEEDRGLRRFNPIRHHGLKRTTEDHQDAEKQRRVQSGLSRHASCCSSKNLKHALGKSPPSAKL